MASGDLEVRRAKVLTSWPLHSRGFTPPREAGGLGERGGPTHEGQREARCFLLLPHTWPLHPATPACLLRKQE